MVNLTRIYTRTGDNGTTNLGDMSTTSKLDLRLAAYADVDEANSHLGVALALHTLPDDVVAVLTHVQNDLFDVGADLSCPIVDDTRNTRRGTRSYASSPTTSSGSRDGAISTTSRWRTLRSFILPGGSPAAAELHVARTVTRRAERSAWAAIDEHGATMNVLTAKYLNRLSDLLFILARYANRDAGDVLWVPGGERSEPALDQQAANARRLRDVPSLPVDVEAGSAGAGVGRRSGRSHHGDDGDEHGGDDALDHDEHSLDAGGAHG